MDAKLPASRDFEVIRHTQNFAEGIRLPVERVERMGSARIHRCGAEKGDPRRLYRRRKTNARHRGRGGSADRRRPELMR